MARPLSTPTRRPRAHRSIGAQNRSRLVGERKRRRRSSGSQPWWSTARARCSRTSTTVMRIQIVDGRQIVGRFMAFDRHMNLVLSDAEEFRKLPPKKGLTEEDRAVRRVLGFILLRGEEVVSMTVEGPPPQEDKRARAQAAPAGPGSGRAAGRGMRHGGCTRAGTHGAHRGTGGPSAASMRPQFSAPPVGAPGFRPGRRPRHAPPGFRPGMPPPGMPPPGFRPGMPPPGMPPPGFRPPGPPPPQ